MKFALLTLLVVCANAAPTALAAQHDSFVKRAPADYQLQKDRFVDYKTVKIQPPMHSEQYFESKKTRKYDETGMTSASSPGALTLPGVLDSSAY